MFKSLVIAALALSPAVSAAESIDVTPGRAPDAVAAELHKHLALLTYMAVRLHPELPPGSDPRVRLIFDIAPSGDIEGPTGSAPARVHRGTAPIAQSLVLDPDSLAHFLPQVVHFPPASVPVSVKYEFTADNWVAARADHLERYVDESGADCKLIPAFQRSPDAELDREIARRKDLPLTLENDASHVVLEFLRRLEAARKHAHETKDPFDLAHDYAAGLYLGLCKTDQVDPKKVCPEALPLLTADDKRSCYLDSRPPVVDSRE